MRHIIYLIYLDRMSRSEVYWANHCVTVFVSAVFEWWKDDINVHPSQSPAPTWTKRAGVLGDAHRSPDTLHYCSKVTCHPYFCCYVCYIFMSLQHTRTSCLPKPAVCDCSASRDVLPAAANAYVCGPPPSFLPLFTYISKIGQCWRRVWAMNTNEHLTPEWC